MSFMGGTFVGATFVTSSEPIFSKISYDKVTIYGSGIFDKIWIRNIKQDNAYYEGITEVAQYQPTFDTDTVFLAEFNQNLSAGNVSSGGEPVQSWLVTKRKIGTNINKFIGEFDADITEAIDFRVRDGSNYIYQITPKTSTKLAQPLLSQEIIADHYGIFLIDEETNLCINFDIEGDVGSMSAENDQTSYKTLNQYNTTAFGDKNFLKGTISGIVNSEVNYCNGVIQSSEFIDLVQDFVNSKSKKLLKTRKGDIYEIVTSGFTRSQYVKQLSEQLDVVSFSFEQIGRITDV